MLAIVVALENMFAVVTKRRRKSQFKFWEKQKKEQQNKNALERRRSYLRLSSTSLTTTIYPSTFNKRLFFRWNLFAFLNWIYV